MLTVVPAVLLLPELGVAYAAGYVAGAPIVHGTHGNRAQALRSVARRLLLPLGTGLAFALVGAAAESDCYDECGLIPAFGFALGAGVGMVAAMVYDVVRAHVDVPVR